MNPHVCICKHCNREMFNPHQENECQHDMEKPNCTIISFKDWEGVLKCTECRGVWHTNKS